MEWKLSQEVGVIHAEGESLEEHILVQGLLVALVGVKLVACWHLAKVLQMRLHLLRTSCGDHAHAHVLTPVAPFHPKLLLGFLRGGMRDQVARSLGFFLRLFQVEGNVGPRPLLPECIDAELLGRWRRDWSTRRKIP